MSLWEIFLMGVGLAMDAFAVSVGKGLEMKKVRWKKAIILALFLVDFGSAYAPIIGWFLGTVCKICSENRSLDCILPIRLYWC